MRLSAPDNRGGPDMTALPAVTFVTGTDTDVGKTITTAALAAVLVSQGRTVAVYKPTQAGTVAGEGDIDVVKRLAGLRVASEGIRLDHPMAPVAAADRAGVQLPAVPEHVETILRLAATHDHILVEGAGGLLVALDGEGATLADLAAMIEIPCAVVVVCRSALGTLNHTELTVEALRRRSIPLAGLVIGSWPRQPSEVDVGNRNYFEQHPVPLIGVIPERAGTLSPDLFRTQAPSWFS